MRLWHWKLISYLPDNQLLSQWRELNSIYKKQDKHILINYIYEYPKDDLYVYSNIVLEEMEKRHYKVSKSALNNYYNYFNISPTTHYKVNVIQPFKNHHNNRYLNQCFYNLQEKYDRGQNNFNKDTYDNLEKFIEDNNTAKPTSSAFSNYGVGWW